jgi:hypothetical protein
MFLWKPRRSIDDPRTPRVLAALASRAAGADSARRAAPPRALKKHREIKGEMRCERTLVPRTTSARDAARRVVESVRAASRALQSASRASGIFF